MFNRESIVPSTGEEQNPGLQLRNMGGRYIVSSELCGEIFGCECTVEERLTDPMLQRRG